MNRDAGGTVRATGQEARIVRAVPALLALAVTLFVLWAAWTGTVTALVLRSAFFSLVAAAGLLEAALRLRSAATRAACYALAVVALVPGLHLWNVHFELVLRGGLSTPFDRVVFVGLLAVLFVLVRLTLGWTMALLAALALLYARFGDLIPGRYGHGGYDLARLTSTLMLSTEGIYGIPMGVAVEYIFPFMLLGTVLVRIGTGEAFVALARAVTGRMPGGPGLAAALASALVGTINGSAVANVVTTGTFTIPLMKRTGYGAVLAGAIEAAASSAGQILPPVMGAAAFLMAEIVGVPYREVALAALVPGLLYVFALLLAIRLEAGKRGLAPDAGAGVDLARATLR